MSATDLESFLKQCGCSTALAVLNDNEVSSVEDFEALESEADVDELLGELGLKLMVRKKLKKAIMKIVNSNANNSNNTNQASKPNVNTNNNNVNIDSDEKKMDDEYEDEGVKDMVTIMTSLSPPVFEVKHRADLKGIVQAPFTTERPMTAIQNGIKNRTILVVGATGTGKTTALNSMANYLFGVKFDDQFRFKLIVENFNHTQAKSMTQDVSAYYLDPPRLPYTLCVVDTPGFGDTDGLEKDKKITKQIQKFFNEKIQEIDAICFCVRAPQARLTAEQRYVFNAVLSLFGNDIGENIFILINFCDGAKPPVLQALALDNIPSNNSFKLNNSGFDLPDPNDIQDEFSQMYWNMGLKAFEKLFISLSKVKTKSLTLTKKVLTRRQELETYIEGVDPLIKRGFSVLEEMRNTIEAININSALVNANSNFEIISEIDEAIQIPTASGINTTTCINCPSTYTCHSSCIYSDNKDKQGCSAMGSDGKCRVCPGRCHWTQHRNLPYTLTYKKKKVTKTVDDLKKKYYDAKSKVSVSDQLIAGLTDKLFKVEKEINQLISNVRDCVNELGKIALRANVLNQDEYINQMMENEKNQRKPGWQKRVGALQCLKEKQNVLKEIHDTAYDPWGKYSDVQDYLKQNKAKYIPNTNNTNNSNNNNNNNNNQKTKGVMSTFLSWFQ